MEWHAIVTVDPYTDQRRRYDCGHELGIDTADVTAEYLGVVPGLFS